MSRLGRPRRLAVLAAVLTGVAAGPSCGGGTTGAPHPSAEVTTATSAAPGRVVATRAAYSLPEPSSRAVVLPDGSDLLVLGGLDTASRSTAAVRRIDPARGAVTRVGALAAAVHDAAGAVLGGRFVVFGGGGTTTVDTVQEFDRAAGSVVGHLPQPRSDLVTVTAGSDAFVLGGYDGRGLPATVLATTDGRTFRVVGSLPVPVRYPAVGLLGRTAWLVGGEHAGAQTNAVQAIDLDSGQARVTGHLSAPLSHASGLVLHGALYVAGGRLGSTPTDQVLRLDPATGSVVAAGRLPLPLADAGSAVLGDTGYLVGGENPRPLPTVVTMRAD